MTTYQTIAWALQADPGLWAFVHVVMTGGTAMALWDDGGRRDAVWSLVMGMLWMVIIPMALVARGLGLFIGWRAS